MELIQTGKIVNTHGIKGEVKIEPWADSPEVLTKLTCLWINGTEYGIIQARVHGNCVLAKLSGVDSMDDAEKLKGKTVSADRKEFTLDEGSYFVADLEGLRVTDADSGEVYGVLAEVIQYPAGNDVYKIVTDGKKELYVPAIRDCIIGVDIEKGEMKIRPLPGLFD